MFVFSTMAIAVQLVLLSGWFYIKYSDIHHLTFFQNLFFSKINISHSGYNFEGSEFWFIFWNNFEDEVIL